MPDSETRTRSGASGASRSVVGEVDAEIAQVAVVDADQRRAERQRAAHLGLVMDLDQRVHAEPPRLGDHRSRRIVVEQREHDQHRVGARDPRLGDLAQVDEEVLGEDRPVELAARGREIVERAAEIGAVAQHAQRIGDAGIAARECRWIGAGRIAPSEGDAFLISRMKRAPFLASAAARLRARRRARALASASSDTPS